MRGSILYCDAPTKFHGKRVNRLPRANSNAVQIAPAAKDQASRRKRLVARNCSAPASPGNVFQQIQTQTAGNSAQYALNASQPSPGATGMPCQVKGMFSSQYSELRK